MGLGTALGLCYRAEQQGGLGHPSVPGALQARTLEWVAVPSPGESLTQGWNLGLRHCRQILYRQPPGKPLGNQSVASIFSSAEWVVGIVTSKVLPWSRNWYLSKAEK